MSNTREKHLLQQLGEELKLSNNLLKADIDNLENAAKTGNNCLENFSHLKTKTFRHIVNKFANKKSSVLSDKSSSGAKNEVIVKSVVDSINLRDLNMCVN